MGMSILVEYLFLLLMNRVLCFVALLGRPFSLLQHGWMLCNVPLLVKHLLLLVGVRPRTQVFQQKWTTCLYLVGLTPCGPSHRAPWTGTFWRHRAGASVVRSGCRRGDSCCFSHVCEEGPVWKEFERPRHFNVAN